MYCRTSAGHHEGLAVALLLGVQHGKHQPLLVSSRVEFCAWSLLGLQTGYVCIIVASQGVWSSPGFWLLCVLLQWWSVKKASKKLPVKVPRSREVSSCL